MSGQWSIVFCAVLLLECASGRHWQRHELDHEESTVLGLQELSAPASGGHSSPPGASSPVTIAPLFMRLLLRQAESGRLPTASGEAAPVDGFRALARSSPPVSVTIDAEGNVAIRFGAAPEPTDVEDGTCVVILAFRDRSPDLEDAELSVELREGEGGRGKVLHRAPVPPGKAFMAFAVDCVGEEGLRVTAAISGDEGPLDGAAALLEIGGAQLGPLLVRSRTHILTDDPVHVWPLLSDDGGGTTGSGVASNDVEAHRKRRRKRRRRHGSGSEEATSSEVEAGHCHLKEWVVSTEEMGWSFVLYPTSISVNLCVGECSSPLLLQRHYNATTHAIARDVYRRLSGNSDIDKVPCAKCVPIQYRKLALLIERSPGSYSLETNSDLSASRCGCR